MKIKKIFYFGLIKMVGKFSPALATKISYRFYCSSGMVFKGRPNYISSSAYFDGGNYSLIELGEGVTISSEVSFLTHDWALNTVIDNQKQKVFDRWCIITIVPPTYNPYTTSILNKTKTFP